MSNIIETIKRHPWWVAGGVFVLGVIFLLATRSGTDTPSTTVVSQPLSDVGASTAMQLATLQANTANTQTAAQASVSMAAIGAALEASKSQDSVSLANIMATADTTKYVSTLAAQQASQEIEATKAINAANVGAAVQVASIKAMSDKVISDNNAAIAFDYNSTQRFAVANTNATQLSMAGMSYDIEKLKIASADTARQDAYYLGEKRLANENFALAIGATRNQNDYLLSTQKLSNDYALGQSQRADNFAIEALRLTAGR